MIDNTVPVHLEVSGILDDLRDAAPGIVNRNYVKQLYEQQRVEEARDKLQKAMGNLMLSPRAHQMLSFLHHKLGDEQAAQIEMMIGRACIEGILASGDGSANDPYVVVRTSDVDFTSRVSKALQ